MRLTHRLSAALILAAAAGAACSDDSVSGPPPSSSRTDQRPAAASDTRHGGGTPATPPSPTDSQPAPRGTVQGIVLRRFVEQVQSSAGAHDTGVYHAVAGATVTITRLVGTAEQPAGTLLTDANGQFRTSALADGTYAFRASTAPTSGAVLQSGIVSVIVQQGNPLPGAVALTIQ